MDEVRVIPSNWNRPTYKTVCTACKAEIERVADRYLGGQQAREVPVVTCTQAEIQRPGKEKMVTCVCWVGVCSECGTRYWAVRGHA